MISRMIVRRTGTELIKEFKNEKVISVCTFKGKLIIATEHGVYYYPKEKKK